MRASIRRLLRRPFNREPGSWSVCAMVAEPPELLCAFAAHYLEQGAQEVHLFIDDPKQSSFETFIASKQNRVGKAMVQRHSLK